MTTPIKLMPKPTASDDAKAASVDLLRRALAEAEAGDVEVAIVILKRPNGLWSNEESGAPNFPDTIGRLEIVKQGWINSYLASPVENRDDK